jgi:hypothetical protein
MPVTSLAPHRTSTLLLVDIEAVKDKHVLADWPEDKWPPPVGWQVVAIGMLLAKLSKTGEGLVAHVLWASRLENVEAFYNPQSIVTIIGHITKKIPDQQEVGDCYGLLCEVAHPNMFIDGRRMRIFVVVDDCTRECL